MISTIRHDSIFDKNSFNVPITIIGAGATGSRVFLALVELGITNITVIDFDKVEPHNLANQAYVSSDIGHAKVGACENLYSEKTGEVRPDCMKFILARVPSPETKDAVKGVVFLLTDTMASRKEIFTESLKDNLDVQLVIETRMASSYGNILSFDPCDEEKSQKWWDTLSDDADTEVSACGSSISVGPTASIIANMAVWQFIHFANNPEAADEVIDLYLKPTIINVHDL